MKPSNQVYEAAHKMLSPELKPFLEWIEAERAETLELLSVAKPEIAQVMQGQTQSMKRILEVIRVSREMLEKKGA